LLISRFPAIICGIGILCGMPCRAVEFSAVKEPASPETVQLVPSDHILVAALTKELPKRDGGLDALLPKRLPEIRKARAAGEPARPIQVYLLLGGMLGPDGPVTSAGMFGLAKSLQALPNTTVKAYTWDKWRQAYKAILANQRKAKIVLVGYSGGGSRATWLANMPEKPRIDLLISYDPSPQWQMKPIGENVKKAICYHNTRTMWFPSLGHLGGGQLVNRAPGSGAAHIHGPSIETMDITEHHLLVQVDHSLHQHTVEAVQLLAKTAPQRDVKAVQVSAKTAPERGVKTASLGGPNSADRKLAAQLAQILVASLTIH
jgi:pimeloyl-ACP methyl ester carboxylesterase